MNKKQESLDELKQIRNIMEQHSRFTSLSGVGLMLAGLCALIGAYFAFTVLEQYGGTKQVFNYLFNSSMPLLARLLFIAALTFFCALLIIGLFTFKRSKLLKTSVSSKTAQQLILHTGIPLIIGALICIKLMYLGLLGLVAPICLLSFGLALVSGSKFSCHELRYLGYAQLVIGILNLYFIGSGFYFWIIGFGFFIMIFGYYMWMRYERNTL